MVGFESFLDVFFPTSIRRRGPTDIQPKSNHYTTSIQPFLTRIQPKSNQNPTPFSSQFSVTNLNIYITNFVISCNLNQSMFSPFNSEMELCRFSLQMQCNKNNNNWFKHQFFYYPCMLFDQYWYVHLMTHNPAFNRSFSIRKKMCFALNHSNQGSK